MTYQEEREAVRAMLAKPAARQARMLAEVEAVWPEAPGDELLSAEAALAAARRLNQQSKALD